MIIPGRVHFNNHVNLSLWNEISLLYSLQQKLAARHQKVLLVFLSCVGYFTSFDLVYLVGNGLRFIQNQEGRLILALQSPHKNLYK